MNTKPDSDSSLKSPLFSKQSLLIALLGSAILLVWAFASMNLHWSSFRTAFLCQGCLEELKASIKAEFEIRTITTFFLSGMLAGFVMFHIRNSRRQTDIIRWMLIAGGSGSVLGLLIGVSSKVPALYSSLWPYQTFGEGRAIYTVAMLSRFGVIAASIAALLVSTERRTILKGIFTPIALGLVIRIFLFSFVPIDTDRLNHPWQVLDFITSSAGGDAGLPIVVALIIVLIRKFKPGQDKSNSATTLS